MNRSYRLVKKLCNYEPDFIFMKWCHLQSSSSCQALCDSSPTGSYKQDPCTLASCNKCLLLSLLVQSSYSSNQTKSPIYEWEGNWTELTFAKTSGIVTSAASSVTIPETIAGPISAPVPFSLLKWRKKEISVQPQTVWLQFAPFTIFLSHNSMPGHA